MEKLKITVIGCGWLGLPLCERLLAAGHEIVTTTTTPKKYQETSAKFNTVLFDVSSQIPDQNLLSSDVIIYTIPPLGKNEVEHFFHAVNPTLKIIFISSTSIYGKSQGDVTEETIPEPQSKNGLILKSTEDYLRTHFKNLTIIRPGGLVGKDRHPVYSLQGKTGLTTGQELLHIVHLDDCLSALLKIIENNFWSMDFNLVNDLRLMKSDYYISEAKRLNLTPPQYHFSHQLNPTNISNAKSKKILGLIYKN